MNAFLELVAVNAVSAAVLAMLVVVITRFVRRPPLAHALWTLVLLKLLVPPVLQVPCTVDSHWFDRQTDERVPPAATDNLNFVSADIDPTTLSTNGATEDSTFLEFDPIASADTPMVASTSADTDRPQVQLGISLPTVSIGTIIVAVWITGSLVWIARALRHTSAFRKLLKHAMPAAELLQAEAASLAARIGLRRTPELRIVDGRISPLVWPAWRAPVVVLPAELVATLDPNQRQTLIAHELAHLRRGDHRWRWLHLAALAVFWWHPVAWLSVRRIQQAEEQCCDAWVVWALENSQRDYARTLLDTIDFLAPTRLALPPQASGLGRFHFLKWRIEMLMQGRMVRQMSIGSRTAILIVGAIILGVGTQLQTAASATNETIADAAAGKEAGSSTTEPSSTNPDADALLKRVEPMSYQGAVYDSPPTAEAKQDESTAPIGDNDSSALKNRLEELEAKVRRLEQQLKDSPKPVQGAGVVVHGPPHLPSPEQDSLIRLEFKGPEGVQVRWKLHGQESQSTHRLVTLPAEVVHRGGTAVNKQHGELTIANFPGQESVELVTRVLVYPPTGDTVSYLRNNSIPIIISPDEFQSALGGSSVLKCVFLERTNEGDITRFSIQTLTTKGDKAERLKMFQEAQRGEMLAALDIGSTVATYVGGKSKMTNPPTLDELVKSLPNISEGTAQFTAVRQRKNLRFVVEKIADEIGETKFYPLVGPAQIHKAQFKCTAKFKIEIRGDWPMPFSHEDDQTEVFYLDHDHLVRVAG